MRKAQRTDRLKRTLPRVTEGGMPEVMAQGNGLRQILV